MKRLLWFLLFSFFLFSIHAQEIILSGEKYEAPYQLLQNATLLTDTSSYWAGYFDLYKLNPPISFFGGSLSFDELDIDESFLFLFNEQAEFILASLFTGSEVYDILQVLAHPPQDTLADIGRMSIKETDTSVIVEYHKVAYELYHIETDSALFLDAQFTYQVHLDYSNDKIKYHFGETRLGPLGEVQMEDLSILSGFLMNYEFNQGGVMSPYIFAGGDPIMPEFTIGEGEFEEIPPFYIEGFPEKGTVYEFSLDFSTSADQVRSLNRFSVFPNPGTNQLTISYPSSSFTYAIRDVLGNVVEEGIAARNAQISTASLPAGTYFIVVGNEQFTRSEVWIKAN